MSRGDGGFFDNGASQDPGEGHCGFTETSLSAVKVRRSRLKPELLKVAFALSLPPK
jgi:hypothetical protein